MKLSTILFQLTAFSGLASAALDAFLVGNNTGLAGSSTDGSFPNSIEVLEFAFGVSNTGSGNSSFRDITFTKRTDRSSTQWMTYAASLSAIKGPLTVYFRKASASGPNGQYILRKLTFNGPIYVTGYSWDYSSGGDDTLNEQISFRFASFRDETNIQTPSGQLVNYYATWNLATNKPT